MPVKGFSMIEVLIAVLILAIGLLGVAALQMASVSTGLEGYFRSQATAIAEDYASRIKANRQVAVASADWTGAGPRVAMENYLDNFVANPIACDPETLPAPMCRSNGGDAAENCTPAQQIAFDQWEVCATAAQLPSGAVHSVRNGLRTTIAVSWLAEQPREDTAETGQTRNPLCNSLFGLDAATTDCVIVEMIP